MKPSPFRPVDDADFKLYNLFRDEVFPLRQKYQDFEDGKYFPSEAAAGLLAKTALIFEKIRPEDPALLFNTQEILASFIAAEEGTKGAFDRALAAFAEMVRPREGGRQGAIVIDDSEDERSRSKRKGKQVEGREGTPDVQFVVAVEQVEEDEVLEVGRG